MKIGFDDNFKSKSLFDVEQFTLKLNQVARILMAENKIDYAYRHWISIPNDKRRSGYYECLGKWDLVYEKGEDVENCGMCRVQFKKDMKDPGVNLVQRVFAANIIRYLTKDTGEVRSPLQVDVLPWVFNDQKYDRLVVVKKEHAPNQDLSKLDLIVKCTNEDFKNFSIDPASKCLLYEGGDTFIQQVAALFKQNRRDDLSELLAKKVTPEQLEVLVADATGKSGNGHYSGGQAPLTTPQDFQNLFDAPPNTVKEEQSKPQTPTLVGASPLPPPPNIPSGIQALQNPSMKQEAPKMANFEDLIKMD